MEEDFLRRRFVTGTMESSWKKNKNMTMLYVCRDLQQNVH